MSLPSDPNRTTPYTIKEGDSGWPVFALQRGLATLNHNTEADGVFGPQTKSLVIAYQTSKGLTADGIAGPATQSSIVASVDVVVAEQSPWLPEGLMRGLSESESGNYLGAVNWSVSGGVDCGVVQIRVYGPPYDLYEMRYAYAPGAAMQKAASSLRERHDLFIRYSYTKAQGSEWAWRCAALAHNWPYGADQYAKYGKLPNPDAIASWVPAGLRFPDGAFVRTRKDWAEFYALGGVHGLGRVTRYVENWT